MSSSKKRRQLTFRIGERAEQRLKEVAGLFNLKPAHYVKALLYKDLGIFDELLDRRRTRREKHGVLTWERDEGGVGKEPDEGY